MFISLQVHTYMDLCSKKFENTAAKVVFFTSILERVYKNCDMDHLEAYFAFINFRMKKEIEKLNYERSILNKNGESIRWFFINVSSQFHEEEDKSVLFRPNEACGN